MRRNGSISRHVVGFQITSYVFTSSRVARRLISSGFCVTFSACRSSQEPSSIETPEERPRSINASVDFRVIPLSFSVFSVSWLGGGQFFATLTDHTRSRYPSLALIRSPQESHESKGLQIEEAASALRAILTVRTTLMNMIRRWHATSPCCCVHNQTCMLVWGR